MNAFEFQVHYIANIMANVVAILVLVAAWKRPNTARLAFFLIFGTACWINWQMVIQNPGVYLNFAQVAVFPIYQQFINGWFMVNTKLAVGFIATSQGLIALAMFQRGRLYKAGIIGGTLFLLAVTPLGIGSAFPCTLILASALIVLWRQDFILLNGTSSLMHQGNYNS